MAHIPVLPTYPESLWQKTAEGLASHPKLEENMHADVVVVGGGITGLTTSYLLAKDGLRVVLLEAGTLFSGTTGHTTAKITAQHDLIYDALIRQEGPEKAGLYYKANEDALRFIQHTVNEHKIECGFTEQDSYVYTNEDSYLSKLQDEMAAYERLGISGSYVDHIPLKNVATKAAIIMRKQAQFHPLQYLSALTDKFVETGGRVFEHTVATDIVQDERPIVTTAGGHQITCDHVVISSHFPFFDGYGFFFARMHAERSYALAVKGAIDYPGGMYLSAEEPKRSIRSAADLDGSPLLILGGQNHKTGQGICTINHYEALQRFAMDNFGTESIVYRWSAQDLVTGDKLPYIGRITENNPNVFLATGFKKWGMTTGAAAALLIRDLVHGRTSPYTELFAPSRSLSLKTLKNLVVENLDVAKHLISGKVEMVYRQPHDLNLDEGAAVSVHGRRAGAYRDPEGNLHVVDTTCTHMGCEVEWNDGERTWDCPCHGSRFSVTGTVLEGPAERPLKTIEIGD